MGWILNYKKSESEFGDGGKIHFEVFINCQLNIFIIITRLLFSSVPKKNLKKGPQKRTLTGEINDRFK